MKNKGEVVDPAPAPEDGVDDGDGGDGDGGEGDHEGESSGSI